MKVDDIDFANSGTISSDVGIFDLKDYSGNNSYNFQLGFGHRGFAGISGWGWLNHCGAEGTNIGASCDSHLSASDFLFTAEKIEVPEPSTLAILMAGLAGLMIRRRKR